jgi:phosphomannomutase
MDKSWKALQNGSDIRGIALQGVAGEEVNLTQEIAAKIGLAFARFVSNKLNLPLHNIQISIGRDSRISSAPLLQSIAERLTDAGCTVQDYGLASTPAMFMSTITEGFKLHGAIMLTASHLPFNRNGLKFFMSTGGLEKADVTAVLELAEKNEALEIPASKGQIVPKDFMSVYCSIIVNNIRQKVKAENYNEPLSGFKIIVDAGNGAGGFFAEKILKPLGADTSGSQFLNPDGLFPNHIPNPESQEAMDSIVYATVSSKADLGIIFDTDVDRAAVVDEKGRQINRDRLVALMAAIVLEEHPGSTIVTDSITSDGLTEFIERKLHGLHHRFKRGYKNVINESIRLNAEGKDSWLAIETSGHAAMKENYFLDDGAYLVSKIIILLARLKKQGLKPGDLISGLREPFESKEFRLNILEGDFASYGKKVIESVENLCRQTEGWELVPNNYEGTRVSCKPGYGYGWFLLRLSLHDPVLPLNVESDEEGGIAQIMKLLSPELRKFDRLDCNSLTGY